MLSSCCNLVQLLIGSDYWYLANDVQAIFSVLRRENACDHPQLITEVADALTNLEHYGSALKYYTMLEGNDDDNSVRKIILIYNLNLYSCHNLVITSWEFCMILLFSHMMTITWVCLVSSSWTLNTIKCKHFYVLNFITPCLLSVDIFLKWIKLWTFVDFHWIAYSLHPPTKRKRN